MERTAGIAGGRRIKRHTLMIAQWDHDKGLICMEGLEVEIED